MNARRSPVLLVTVDRRLRPETIVFDSRRLDPATHARLYLTASSGPLVIQGATSSTARRRRRKPGGIRRVGKHRRHAHLPVEERPATAPQRGDVMAAASRRSCRRHLGRHGLMARHLDSGGVHLS